MIELFKGDITQVEIDAIVNAANTSLLGGGGVDGAIHRKGGPDILEDCRRIRQSQGSCKVGEAVITRSGNLPCEKVIHTVGPVYNCGGKLKDDQLASCYLNSLKLLLENGLSSIAFPNISTGLYKFPKERAAQIALEAVESFDQKSKIEKVLFVCYDEENYKIYKKLLL